MTKRVFMRNEEHGHVFTAGQFYRNFPIPKARYKGRLITLLWSSQTTQWPHDSPD